jgi:hypothetical protein
MQTEYLITVDEFCSNHNIEVSFIGSLQQTGLIEFTTIEETKYLEVEQLREIEKYIRFHYDMDINIEGIETISHMLKRINTMHNEITSLRNRLRLYETEE